MNNLKMLCFFVIALLLSLPIHGKQIYVFGDSHTTEFSEVPLCKIIYFGPVTMHRIGRDGLSVLDLRNHGVSEGDIAVFVFGEIDVRCHMGRQRDLYNRSLDEVIETLANSYFETILQNRNFYSDLTCAVYSVTPPTDNSHNELYPRYSTLKDRVEITKKLNAKLSQLCILNQVHFIDVFDYFSNEDGSLKAELCDGNVHILPSFNRPLLDQLYRCFDEQCMNDPLEERQLAGGLL